MKEIVVLGGGAAGLAAAIAAAEQAAGRARVTVVERGPRVGKKLLATGNGRCNLDNLHISPDGYFSTDPAQAAQKLAAIYAADPLGWFEAHGLVWRADEAGRVYPHSNQAADLVALLEHHLARCGVEVRTGCTVSALEREKGRWLVSLEEGEPLRADAVICAMGGSAGPQFGTDGFGLSLAGALGLACAPAYPCLVPLQCAKKQVAGLAGIRVKASATLAEGGRPLHTEQGEVQFTDYGLSGIAVMQLSGRMSPGSRLKQPEILLDLFPGLSFQELLGLLYRHSRALGEEANAPAFFTGLLNRKVGLAVWRAQRLGEEKRPVSTLSKEEWRRLAQGLKQWRFSDLRPTGWKNAQTTGGGVLLSQLESESFAVKGRPGLYFVGETTDCAGSCGGFNLHWAFGSGILAGRDAASR